MRGPWRRAAVAALVIAAAVGLWIWSGRGPKDEAWEVPLLGPKAADVVGIEVRRVEGTTRFAATDGVWHLTGAVADYVDTSRVPQFLGALAAATSGPAIPGADADDSRFGFAEADAVDLLLTFRDGTTLPFGMGLQNPVTGVVYARGAGHEGVFVVAGPLRDLWSTLPDAVRLRRLLPVIARADVDTVRIFARGAAQPLVIARADGRWWARLTANGLGTRSERYRQYYHDRDRSDAAGSWVLADDSVLASLIFEVSETQVTAFAPLADEEFIARDAGLEPAYRGVELVVAGGNRHRLEFGEVQAENLVWARRGPRVVATRSAALRTLERPFADFVDLGAFSFRFAQADSFQLDDRVAGRADPDSAGRWIPLATAGGGLPANPRQAGNLLSDMQMAFDRLPALEILPPAAADPLETQERFPVTAWLPGDRRHQVILGRLRDGGRPAVWEPADGKVLLISEEVLISMRALRLSFPAS